MPKSNEELYPRIDGEAQVYLNGKPCDFSEFSVSADFLDAWLTEEPTNNSDNATETQANKSEPQLNPGDYVPSEVREAFKRRIYSGDLEQARQAMILEHNETDE